MAATQSPLLLADEAAAYLRISRVWIYRHADQLGCVRDGGPLRFRRESLDAWIAAHESRPRVVREVPRRQPKAPAFALDPGRINRLTGLPYGSRVPESPDHAAGRGRPS